MALDDIKKTILDEAQKQAGQIKAGGEKRAALIKAGWDEKVAEKKEEIVATAKRKADQKIQQSQFKIQAQAQAQILNLKQKIISKVYDEALKKLAGFDDAKYIELMEKLISLLPETGGKLISAIDKESLLKKAMAKSGRKYELASETVKVGGGFIFQSKELEIDNTFKTLIANSKDQTGLEVARLLFEEQK